MKNNFALAAPIQAEIIYIGIEKQPLLIVDNLLQFPLTLIDYAETGPAFQKDVKDFYPGVRKTMSSEYARNLSADLQDILRKAFSISNEKSIEAVSCVLSLATTPPQQLRPIQSVPHIDSYNNNLIAVVHYLCEPHHGGTSFYRHRSTGYESLSEEKLQHYAPLLKSEVIANREEELCYMNGDNALFERTAQIEAKFNRAIFYFSNILHSGNVQAGMGLSDNPRNGRLTANTLLQIC